MENIETYESVLEQNLLNDSSQMGCREDGISPALIPQQILFGIVCIVGLLGNTLVIYVVIRFSKMQTVTNMYIVNLAIADECFLIGIPFLIITMYKKYWIFGNAMCKIYLASTSVTQFTSSIFLFIMSADRYIAVCHPIASPKWRTPLISRIVSVTAWTCSVILMTPVFMYAREINRGENSTTTCNILWGGPDDETANGASFIIYSFVSGFTTPFILILVFYCLVIKKLKTVGPKNKSKEKRRSHRKVTNLVLTVITVYLFCWLPYWITQISLVLSSPEHGGTCHSQFTMTLFLLASCLSYSNSAMNPILYAFLSDNFKKSFVKACTCAGGREVNATLHMENSVFPRKNKQGSERFRPTRATSICPGRDDDEGDLGALVSKGEPSTSAITMTSRSNITFTTDVRDTPQKESLVKNGVAMTLQPTQL